MKIAYNTSAVIAQNALLRNDNKLSASLAKLSSGLKLVNPKDNPSGLAMAKRMNAQLEGISIATQNASDSVSVIGIADGAMSEVHDILQRINELSVKASTGTLTDADRKLIQEEVSALKEEITRIAETTEFNGQKLLNGAFDLKGYTSEINVKVASYSDSAKAGIYSIPNLSLAYDVNGNIDLATIAPAPMIFGAGFPADAAVTKADGKVLTIENNSGFKMQLEFQQAGSYSALDINVLGIGSMDMQIGANEGQQLDIRIPKVSLENIGISNIDLSTEAGAKEALGKMDGAISYVSSIRSRLGAYQNRLEHTINNLDITSENMMAAYSRIMDVDMAEEMTEYTTLQVISQASTSMLAQANERPSQVLQLLQ